MFKFLHKLAPLGPRCNGVKRAARREEACVLTERGKVDECSSTKTMQATIFIHLWLCNSTNDTNIFLSVLITTFWINYDRRTVQNLLAPTHYSKKEVVLFRAIMIISRVRLLKFLFQVRLLLCVLFLSIFTVPAPMWVCLFERVCFSQSVQGEMSI